MIFWIVTLTFVFLILLALLSIDSIKSYRGKYIVGRRGMGKTALATAENILIMRDKKRLEKSNQTTNRLRTGGYIYLQDLKQIVHADYRVTLNSYWQDKGHCESTVSNYLNGYEVGLVNTPNPLFKRTLPPYAHVSLDEIDRYYNSRNSFSFPEEVSRWHQLCRHNDITVTMTAQRAMDMDAKIREIIDVYQEIQFMWVVKNPFTKKISFILWRVWEWQDYNDFMAKKKPLNRLQRFIRWLFWLPSKSARRTFIFKGNVFDHYDSQYHRPNFYFKESAYKYVEPPKHQFDYETYTKYLDTVQAERPVEFMKESIKELRKRSKAKKQSGGMPT